MSIDLTKPELPQPQWTPPVARPLSFTPLPETYYSHSGKAPFGGIALGLALGLVAGPLLALLYSYITLYLPFIYINFLISIGFGIGVGLPVGFGLKTGKVRNTPVAMLLGGAAALWTFYFVWAFWVFALVQRAGNEEVSLLDVLLNPLALGSVILKINETGAWTLFSFAVSGISLWVVWGIEALIILITPIVTVLGFVSDPFCETCGRWAEEEKAVREFKCVASQDELKEIVRRKDYGTLLEHPRRAGDVIFYRADVHKCKNCNVFHVLKVEEVTLKIDENGKASESKSAVVENLLINASEMAALGS